MSPDSPTTAHFVIFSIHIRVAPSPASVKITFVPRRLAPVNVPAPPSTICVIYFICCFSVPFAIVRALAPVEVNKVTVVVAFIAPAPDKLCGVPSCERSPEEFIFPFASIAAVAVILPVTSSVSPTVASPPTLKSSPIIPSS